MLKTSPNPIDVQDFQFKLQCKLKVIDNTDIEPFSKNCNLVATSSHYGLIFIGGLTSFQIVRCSDLDQLSAKDGEKCDYLRREIPLDCNVSYLSVNCDSSILAVVLQVNNCPVARFYNIKSFLIENVEILNTLQLSPTPGVTAVAVDWNPTIPEIFTACKSDGSLGLYEIKSSVSINELPVSAGATCFCWSPKGKQIAVGSRDGKITQYKPDLKAVRLINSPPLQDPHVIITLHWISNYQFIGVYLSTKNNVANLIVVDAPKSGDALYTAYDDICYSSYPVRPIQFYMIHQQQWNILMVASANSMEVGVLYNVNDSWTQLTLMDSARAELPLSLDHSDTLPIGFAFDTSSVEPMPWGESSIPPPPKLFMLSHYGVLCCFNTVNLKDGAPQICSPPVVKVEGPGMLRLFTNKSLIGTSNAEEKRKDVVEKTSASLNSQATTNIQSIPNIFPVSSNIMVSSNTPVSSNIFANQMSQLNTPSQDNTTGFTTPMVPSVFKSQHVTFHNTPSASLTSESVTTNNPPSIFAQTSAPKEATSTPNIFSAKPQSTGFLKDTHKPPAFYTPKETGIKKDIEPLPLVQPSTIPTESETFNDSEVNELLMHIIKDECQALESEMNVLLLQAKSLKIAVGSNSEKETITELTIKLQSFLNEVVNNYTVQKSDIHILKQNLIQTWAWLEEARSRYKASNDGTIATILRAQPLDSAAEKQLLHIRHLMYYLESQAKQAHGALDEQWENFQDYCRKTYRIQLPTMETVFQTMKRHNDILNKLSYNLKDISMRIKSQNEVKVKSMSLVALKNLKKIQEDMNQLSLEPQDIFKMHYERVMFKNKMLSQNKTFKLRNYLKKADARQIASHKPSVSQAENLQHAITKMKESSLKVSSPASAEVSKIKETSSAETKLSLFTMDPDKLKTPQKVLSFGKDTSLFSKTSSSPSAPSAFVPTSHSSAFFDNSIGFKTPAPGPENLFSTFKPPPITLVTTASPFSNTSTKFVAATKPDSVLKSSLIQTPNQALASSPASFTFAPQKDSALKFKFGSSEPSNTVTDNIPKSPMAATSKAFNLNLPSSEVTISKIPTSNKSMFNLPSDVQLIKVSSSGPGSVSTFGTSVGVAVAKPFASTFSSPVQFQNVDSTGKPQPDLPKSTVNIPFSFTKNDPEDKSIKTSVSSTPESLGLQSSTSTQALSKADVSNTTSSLISKSDIPAPKTTDLFSNVKLSSVGDDSNLSSTNISQGSPFFSASENLKFVSSPSSIFGGIATAVTSSVPVSSSASLSLTTPTSAEVSKSVFGNTGTISADTTKKVETAVTGSVFNISALPTTQPSLFAGISTSKPSVVSTTEVTDSTSSINQGAFTFIPKTTLAPSLSPQTTVVTSSNQSPVVSSSSQASVFSNLSLTEVASKPPTLGSVQGESSTSEGPQTSIFGVSNQNQVAPALTSQASIFGASTQNQVTATSASQKSIFGGSTQSPLFDTQKNQTATSAPQTSIFGVSSQNQAAVTSSSAKTSIFGVSNPSQTSTTSSSPQTSIFAVSNENKTATTSSLPQTSIFGASSQNQTAISTAPQTSVFGAKSNQVTSSLFATTSQNQANSPISQSSLFGISNHGSVTSSAGQTSIFSNSSASPFQGTGTVTSKPSVFGTTTGSIFGNTSNITTTASSIFGNTVASTVASPFGSSTGTPIFGSPFTPASTATTPFGGAQSSSVFGTSNPIQSENNAFASQPTAFSSFGTSSTTPSFTQPSPFGNIFGGSSAVSTNASSPANTGIGTSNSAFVNIAPSQFGAPAASSSNIFGGAATSSNSFSFATPNTNTFGFGSMNVSSTTAPSSGFGSNANPFAKSNIFSTPSTQSSSVFGSSSPFGGSSQSAFGSTPAFGTASAPAFGQQSVFGQSTFGNPQPGPFSGGSNSVAQTGFASPAFQKPGGFGSPPAFGSGSSPSFGAPPTFGGAPTFGSAPAFGSPEKVFGSSSLGGGFQSTTQENSTFANLANQNTVGFGSLAQQAQNQSSPFSANTSFTSWR